MIQVRCGQCGRVLKAVQTAEGRFLVCPACGSKVVLAAEPPLLEPPRVTKVVVLDPERTKTPSKSARIGAGSLGRLNLALAAFGFVGLLALLGAAAVIIYGPSRRQNASAVAEGGPVHPAALMPEKPPNEQPAVPAPSAQSPPTNRPERPELLPVRPAEPIELPPLKRPLPDVPPYTGPRPGARKPDVETEKPPAEVLPGDPTPANEKVRYLSDLPEFDVAVAEGRFAKHGDLGYRAGNPQSGRILVNGKESPNGISMCPNSNTYAVAKYRLGRAAKTFLASAALNDSAGGAGQPPGVGTIPTPLTFLVVGDGKVLWKSKPVNAARDVQECKVDVSKVNVLEIRVACPGSYVNAQSVWLEPRVEVSTPTGGGR